MEEKSFIDHLSDFRLTIIKIILSLIIGTGVCFYFAPSLLTSLKAPLMKILANLPNDSTPKFILQTLNPTGSFLMAIKISFFCGLLTTLPINLYFLGAFIIPALTKQEKGKIIPAFFIGTILFFLGVLFCYKLVLPISLEFLWNFSDWMEITNNWTIEYYVSFATQFLLIFGFIFELPIVILTLVKLNILSYRILTQYRRYVIVIVFVTAALLTPPDIFTQLLMALPLIVLYEISVLGAFFIDKKKNRLAG